MILGNWGQGFGKGDHVGNKIDYEKVKMKLNFDG
jgi:hypothetical protein